MIIGFKASAKKFFPCYSMTEMLDMKMEVTETIQHDSHGTMYKIKSGRCIPSAYCRIIDP